MKVPFSPVHQGRTHEIPNVEVMAHSHLQQQTSEGHVASRERQHMHTPLTERETFERAVPRLVPNWIMFNWRFLQLQCPEGEKVKDQTTGKRGCVPSRGRPDRQPRTSLSESMTCKKSTSSSGKVTSSALFPLQEGNMPEGEIM